MKILDYESGHLLNDVAITLTPAEASELAAYLDRLVQVPSIGHAHVSEIDGDHLERELTVTLELGPEARTLAG